MSLIQNGIPTHTDLTISRHIRTCRLFGAWTELYPQQWHVLLERYSIGFTNEITIDVNRFSIIVVLWVKLTCLWVSRTGQITEDCRSYHLSFFSNQPSALLPPVGSLSSGLVSHEVINHYFPWTWSDMVTWAPKSYLDHSTSQQMSLESGALSRIIEGHSSCSLNCSIS